MLALRVLLISIVVVLLVYTGFVGASQGWNFMPVFIQDILAVKWPGQFNLDFACVLLLAALWLAWRHRFSPVGIVLGLLTLLAGSPMLCTYLLVSSLQAQGDVKVLLLGPSRAA